MSENDQNDGLRRQENWIVVYLLYIIYSQNTELWNAIRTEENLWKLDLKAIIIMSWHNTSRYILYYIVRLCCARIEKEGNAFHGIDELNTI